MKLHLNLTLRRAVLAAMATMAVYTTQADETTSFPGGISNGQYLVTGTTITSASYNSETENYTPDIFIGGGKEGNADLTLTDGASITANSVNVGNSHNAITGTLTVGAAPETDTEIPTTPETDTETSAQKASVTTNQLNVGCYAGQGTLVINKDGEVTVSGNGSNEFDSSLNLGYHTTATTNEDTIIIAGGTLTVGSSDIKNAKVSIGALNSHAFTSMEIKDGGSATFYGQTIVGENGQTYGTIEVKDGATLNMEGNTVVGLTSSAYGTIIGEGTVDEKGDYDTSIRAGNMTVGDKGNGSIELYNAQLTADAIAVAKQAGSYGEIFVGSAYDDGAPVTTTKTIGKLSTELLSIGQAGEGEVTIADDSSLSATNITLGYASTGDGTLTIGKNASIGDITNLVVGYEGKGTLTTASSLKTKALHVRGKDSTATISDEAVLTTGNLTIVNGGYLDVTGTATVAGDTLLDNSSSINVSGILTTNGTTEEGANGSTVIGGTITIEKGGTWNANGSTAGFGTIANDGTLNVDGSMVALQGITGTGDTGTGDIEVAEGSSLTLTGKSTQGTITNLGTINLSSGATLTAEGAASGDGRYYILVDANTNGNASPAIKAGSGDLKNTHVQIDISDASELVGKNVAFAKSGDSHVGLNQKDNFTLIEGTEKDKILWDKGHITYTTSKEVTGEDGTTTTVTENNRLCFTYEGTDDTEQGTDDTEQTVKSINFTNIQANITTVTTEYTGVEAEIYDTAISGTTNESQKVKEGAITGDTNPVTKDDKVTTVELKDEVSATQHNIVIAKNVTTTSQGTVTLKSTATVQETVIAGQPSQGQPDAEIIGTGGLALSISGATITTGTGDAVLGFAEGSAGKVTTENGVANEVKTVDVIILDEATDWTLTHQALNENDKVTVHSTHALIINGGDTEENRSKLTIGSGTSLVFGGSDDVNLTYEAEVKHYDDDGNCVGTEVMTRESANHITTDSEIINSDVVIQKNSHLSFKTINDKDHYHHGETHITNSTVTLGGKGAELGVEPDSDTAHPMQTIVFDNKSTLKGSGHAKHIKMNGGRLSVGNSPGALTVSQFVAENRTVLDFTFITDSDAWTGGTGTAYSGKCDTTYGSGNLSQLLIDKAVTLNGVQVTFVYEKKSDAGTTEAYTAQTTKDGKEALAKKVTFADGDAITLIDNIDKNGDLSELSGSYTVDYESLPTLADDLFWDVDRLFSTGKIYVIGERLEEPWRIANTLVSAGETVLNFGRVAEAQAILRKAGTTRVWGSAIAMFDSIDSGSTTNGYDYNSWGGAVGVDHAFTSRTVLGVAFGCSWGENEPENGTDFYDGGSIDQDARMIGIYGTHKFRTKGLMNDMKLSAFAAYGMFENDSTRTGLKSGHNATAEWDSDAWVLSASLSRDITTDSGVVFTPYVGVEYTKAGMDDFTEKGKSYNATYTADEDYSNLTVKVGVSVSKTIGSFTPYAGISYICDVARDTPKVTASGKRTITGEASMPGRHALRFNVGTGVKLSDSWDAYAGYSAELRDKATEHNVNVGVGYTF